MYWQLNCYLNSNEAITHSRVKQDAHQYHFELRTALSTAKSREAGNSELIPLPLLPQKL